MDEAKLLKKTRVLTVDDFASLLEAAVTKMGKNKHTPPRRPDIDELRRRQDKSILKRELNQEKREKVKTLAKSGAPAERQLEALGGDSTLTPLQLAKFHARPSSVGSRQDHPQGSLWRDVLGLAPSTREMERFADINMKLRGSSIGSNARGEITVGGYPISGSDIATAIRYLVRGSRGHRGVPPGVDAISTVLRERGIASSKFPESVRTLLGGLRGRKLPVDPSPERLTPAQDGGEDDSEFECSDDVNEQSGSGLDNLRAACDLAEQGEHDKAWDALNAARQLRAPRSKLKDVELYIDQFR